VSILARSKGVGGTALQREGDRILFTRTELFSRVVISMSGIAAEEMVIGEPSTGSEDDLEKATEIARDIVGRYGMSPALGRARLLVSDIDAFLGGDAGFASLGSETHEAFDAEVRRLLAEAETEAHRILSEQRTTLDEMAAKLEELETLEGKALEDLVSNVPVDPNRLRSVFGGESNGRASAPKSSEARRS
jgi:cell division protease FtsH